MTASLNYVEGGAARLSGVDVDGRPFVALVGRGGVINLGRQCWTALLEIDRADARIGQPEEIGGTRHDGG